METHHVASISNLVRAFEHDPEVSALILGGSIAHGFARPDSDIDVTFVVPAAVYARHQQSGVVHYNNRALCTYDGGYIDGKYADVDFLRLVAARGSDPARYAFKDARILFSRIDGLDRILADIIRYPVDQKQERIHRFVAQLLAWRWYYSEALRQQNQYLVFLAVHKIVLFSCRVVLAANEMLYPYHKWLLRVVQTAPRQPPELAAKIEQLLTGHSWERVDGTCLDILAFVGISFDEANATWPSRFMRDTELRWVSEESGIDDL
jgi:predicted nucleotidyltransferase